MPRILAFLILFFLGCGVDSNKNPSKVEPPIEVEKEQPKSEDTQKFSLSISDQKKKESEFCPKEDPKLSEDPTPAHRFDIQLLKEKLAGEGLRGWMHGIVPEFSHYVFTYRKEDPNDFMAFFKAEQFALTISNKKSLNVLKQLNRHDEVRLFGVVIEGQSPFRHIIVNDIQVLKTFAHPTENSYEMDPKMLNVKESFKLFGKVHATVASETHGSAIVMEHKKMMLPIIFPDNSKGEFVKDLFRNDILEIEVQFQQYKNRPTHLVSVSEESTPWKMIDRIANCHGAGKTLDGHLVKFIKSPSISTDVYAVRLVDANGIGRNFTFFPDTEDSDEFINLFEGLKTKAEEAWNKGSQKQEIVRNYWQKTEIKVKASGKINVVSLEQANPQIYIRKLSDLTFNFE